MPVFFCRETSLCLAARLRVCKLLLSVLFTAAGSCEQPRLETIRGRTHFRRRKDWKYLSADVFRVLLRCGSATQPSGSHPHLHSHSRSHSCGRRRFNDSFQVSKSLTVLPEKRVMNQRKNSVLKLISFWSADLNTRSS